MGYTATMPGARIRLLATVSLASALWACAVTPPDPSGDRDLVDEDAPVFDPRFRDVDPGSLDLSRFWTERRSPAPRAPIWIHHRTYADLVESVGDGIVNLYTRVVQERKAVFGISPGDLLPFRIPVVSPVLDVVPFKVPIPFRTEGTSLGSGFLINEGGYILTNAHVVHNATDIRVVRSGMREEYPARIIGSDRLTDTALLRIEAQPGMTVLPFGSSEDLAVGELVVAVGNPLGLNHTVTSGVVSAKERIVGAGEAPLIDFLQTDSAINPGSSGGPLLNVRGEVVGINTAIASGAQAIGFAIPIDIVKQVMRLLVLGRTERGFFGASARPMRPGEARQRGHPNPDAVVIDEVTEGSPAAAVGVRAGDVVARIGGDEIANFVAFRRHLLGLLPGDPIALTLIRDGESFEIQTALAEHP